MKNNTMTMVAAALFISIAGCNATRSAIIADIAIPINGNGDVRCNITVQGNQAKPENLKSILDGCDAMSRRRAPKSP